MDMHPEIFQIFNELNNEGKLKLRIQGFLKAQNNEYRSFLNTPSKGNRLNIIGLKFYADGALGSRGALLFGEYSDASGNYGLELLSKSELYKKAKIGIENGFAIAVHAIGDKANYNVLQVYQQLHLDGVASKTDILRIEHAQIIRPEDFELFSKYNIFAAVQPVHCLSDAKMARARIGERIQNSYPWSCFIENGIVISGGSDFPIESYDPIVGLNAFIHRIPFNENVAWVPEQLISPAEAIKAYTIGAHKMSGNDNIRGKILTGMDGDLTVLDKNICRCNNEELSSTQVKGVFINSELILK
jgi:predicted amidohydrolase YtcJ